MFLSNESPSRLPGIHAEVYPSDLASGRAETDDLSKRDRSSSHAGISIAASTKAIAQHKAEIRKFLEAPVP
jgi:hypothetical protein